MNATIYVSLLICLLGLGLYLYKSPAPKDGAWAEVGRISFAFGLLVTLYMCANKLLHF